MQINISREDYLFIGFIILYFSQSVNWPYDAFSKIFLNDLKKLTGIHLNESTWGFNFSAPVQSILQYNFSPMVLH